MIIFEKVNHDMFGIIYLTPGNPVTLGDPSATSACVFMIELPPSNVP